MATHLVTFDRSFQIWRYFVSHKTMLLRSTKADPNRPGHATRVDILIKPVGFIQLPTTLSSVSISECTEEEWRVLKIPFDPYRKLFSIRSGDLDGYVVASFVAWHEDFGEYCDPSHFAYIDWLDGRNS